MTKEQRVAFAEKVAGLVNHGLDAVEIIDNLKVTATVNQEELILEDALMEVLIDYIRGDITGSVDHMSID
jgi:hypothetical protein